MKLIRLLPITLALVAAFGLVAVVRRSDGSLPKAGKLFGWSRRPPADDWCAEHSVPESVCVECGRAGEKAPSLWSNAFGVHLDPLERPELAECPSPEKETAAARKNRLDALRSFDRATNSRRCTLHDHLIQVATEEAVKRIGIELTTVRRGPATEEVSVYGELDYDPRRVARISPRVSGVVAAVYKRLGDEVAEGEILVAVEAPEVGKARAEYAAALLDEKRLASLAESARMSEGAVASRVLREADAAAREATAKRLLAFESLNNLGVAPGSGAGTESDWSLLPVRSPIVGRVVERTAVVGEASSPAKPLLVVADARRLILTLQATPETADRIKPEMSVSFQHDGHASRSADGGVVSWISPVVDEKTRTVPIRVELPNPAGEHHAKTFGLARVVLRRETQAMLVPTSAIHHDGNCQVAFVAVRSNRKDETQVFRMRSIRTGATTDQMTEVFAGLSPDELVVAAGGGGLRAAVLKANLGAG